jgi:hypothetical protein
MVTELDKEREERNYFQLERDKINSFWEITKRQCVPHPARMLILLWLHLLPLSPLAESSLPLGEVYEIVRLCRAIVSYQI